MPFQKTKYQKIHNRAISDETLHFLLEAAMCAPSAQKISVPGILL